MARLYDRSMDGYEADAEPRRAALLQNLGKRIVEFGPGTGVNLKYVHEESSSSSSPEWIGIEPSKPMRDRLHTRAAKDYPELELRFADLQDGVIDVEDGWADTVISTLVLCSVPDQAAALREAHRVLRPGGRYLFMEHVAAKPGTSRRLAQTLMTPFWKLVTDGCCLNRETGAALRAAGFGELELVEYEAAKGSMPFFARSHILGSATK
jgi:SAM-dependent methyltransferase